MIRIIHKETGKALVISDSHGEALAGGRDPKYRIDESFDPEAHKKLVEDAMRAKRDAQFAEAEAEEAAAKEEAKEVSIEKEKKPAPKKKQVSK